MQERNRKRTVAVVKREIALEELKIDLLRSLIEENEQLSITLRSSVEHEKLVEKDFDCRRKRSALLDELERLQDRG